jgi:hypothetical protein
MTDPVNGTDGVLHAAKKTTEASMIKDRIEKNLTIRSTADSF